MAVTYSTVREVALRFPNVQEGFAYGTPSLHVGRKLMARLWEDGQTLVSKMDPSQRAVYFELAPDTFFLTDHYKTSPVILVDLTTLPAKLVPELIEIAWRCVAPAKLIKAYDVT